MSDILTRLRRLPPPLVDGQWTNCALSVVNGRIRFREPAGQSAQRRMVSLRRRGIRAGLGVLCLGLAVMLPVGPAAGAFALFGSLFLLAALDKVGQDLHAEQRPFEYAVIDSVRDEVDLRAPGGWVLTAPLRDIRMFLLVADVDQRRCHLGVVLHNGAYLPWLSTPAAGPAHALTWVFGHLTQRPAMRVLSGLPLPADWITQVEPIEAPTPVD